MKVDFSNLNPPAWFSFDEDDPDEGRVLLRVCSPEDARRIEKACSKKQPPEYKGGVRYELPPKVDEEKYNRMLWDWVIVDWDGVLDADEKPIECNAQNKERLMMGSPWFTSFVTKNLEKLNADNKIYQGNLEKNSLSTQND